METLRVRLLPYEVDTGPRQMAADEVLLDSAAHEVASLRFYGWSEATVSLGYFQHHEQRREHPQLLGLPWVRRPSGGATLVHHHELTYCLALPIRSRGLTGEPWLRMHQVIARALATFGVRAHPHVPTESDPFAGLLCFEHFTAGDLILDSAKITGSAQRKQRGAVMQHGGILLAQSPFTPTLPGIRERTGLVLSPHALSEAITTALMAETGWAIQPATWTPEEQHQRDRLAQAKYTSAAWNEKR